MEYILRAEGDSKPLSLAFVVVLKVFLVGFLSFSASMIQAADSAQLYAQIRPAVVTLSVKRALLFASREKPNSQATGFMVAPGLVLTANHAVDAARSITVQLSTGEQLEAKLIKAWDSPDLALLKVSSTKVPYITFRESGAVPGESVWAFGAPFDFPVLMTQGVISSSDIEDPAAYGLQLLATDATANPGMSGGPLIGADGQLVGLISQIHTTSEGRSGISLAIPVDRIYALIKPRLNSTSGDSLD